MGEGICLLYLCINMLVILTKLKCGCFSQMKNVQPSPDQWEVISQVAQFLLAFQVTCCGNTSLQGSSQIQLTQQNLAQVMGTGGKASAFRTGSSQGNESCANLKKGKYKMTVRAEGRQFAVFLPSPSQSFCTFLSCCYHHSHLNLKHKIFAWIVDPLMCVCQLLSGVRLSVARPLCPWDSPGKNAGVGRQALLQGIILTQGSNPGLLHCRWILYCLSHQGNPKGILSLLIPLCQSYASFTPNLLFFSLLMLLPGAPHFLKQHLTSMKSNIPRPLSLAQIYSNSKQLLNNFIQMFHIHLSWSEETQQVGCLDISQGGMG